jgi:uncharacterized protein
LQGRASRHLREPASRGKLDSVFRGQSELISEPVTADSLTAAGVAGPAGPLSAAQRLPALDVLRGVAILGVLLSFTLWNLGSPPAETWNLADRILNTAGELLIDAKFLTLFAFLFGVGNSQQWRRAESKGQNPVPRHVRRMIFLFVVGLLHGALLRNGDILAPYAILGIALIGARHLSNRALVAAAIFLALLPYAIQGVMQVAGWSLIERPGPEGGNLDWLRYWYLTNPLISWPRILAIMLAGVLAERTRLVAAVAANRRLARRILLAALPLAVASRVILVLLATNWHAPGSFAKGAVLNLTYHFSAWSLATAYAAGIALLCMNERWVSRLGWLRATGRMAFTNYLLQAIIIVPICLAFNLYDAVTPTLGLLLALVVAAIGIPFSTWWLRHHEHGPLERLWRRATYGNLPAVRTP